MKTRDRVPYATRMAAAGFVAVMLLTVALRLYGIDRESAWLDEVLSLGSVQEDSFADYWAGFSAVDPNAVMAPAYFITQFVWAKVVGSSLIALRLYSVLLGTLAIFPLFLIGRRLFNSQAGLIACFCYAVSLNHIVYAQETRMHVFATLFALISMWAFLAAIDTNQKSFWWVNAIANAIMLFSSPMTGFVFAVQGTVLLVFHREPYKRFGIWVLAHFSMIFLVGAWGIRVWGNTENPFWMARPSLREVLNILVVFLGGRFSNDDPSPYLIFPFSLEPLMVMGFLAALIFLVTSTWQRRAENATLLLAFRSPLILFIWLALPMMLLFFISLTWKPFFEYRYLLYCSFPMYLIVGSALANVESSKRKAILFCCIVFVVAYQHTVRLNHTFRPNYQAALTRIESSEKDTAPVLVLKGILNGLPLQYLEGWESIESYYAPGQTHLHDMSLDLLGTNNALWVLMWRWDRMEEYESLLAENDVSFTKEPMGGMPVMYLYRLETQ